MSASRGGDRSGAGQPAPSREATSDLAPRVIVALPAILFAVFIVWQGDEVFALGLMLLGTIAL
ncbi:MAG: hypothetical protein ACRDLA_15640, partial [Thermoleophilaceae bacterium]